MFAYDKTTVRVWLPRGSRNGKQLSHIVYVGQGWGNITSPLARDTAELRVLVSADKCMDKTQVVDAQGYCRDISEVQLVQHMAPWGEYVGFFKARSAFSKQLCPLSSVCPLSVCHTF